MAQGDGEGGGSNQGMNNILSNPPINQPQNPSTPTSTPTHTPTTPTPTTPTPTTPAPTTMSNLTSVVPGPATPGTGQMNVADYGSSLVTNPSSGVTNAELLSKQSSQYNIDPNTAGTNVNQQTPIQTPTANTSNGTASTASQVDPRQAQTYDAALSQQNIAQNGQATAAQGQINNNDLITNTPQIDMQGAATGTNADGSTNYTGQALQQAAIQNLSNIIDTSTPAGKALAQSLGQGNYLDSKATLKGQLDTLQSEFMDAQGNPKIPGWAAATARNVAKIASFSGMTGTAATAAMAQALMEASIPVAQQDAQFFQTTTLKNLDNEQQMTLNRANVLAKFDLTNMDNRMAAAVNNSKAFLQMDMTNLNNEQQAELLNTQARVQSILQDTNQENAARLFGAQSENDMNKFYDQLGSQISQFNASQLNGMSQFNASQDNAVSEFNSNLENQNQQFEKSMQYNIDMANAKWRQNVTTQNSQNAFNAAATDVKTLTGISQEQLNNIWHRSDSLLDYAWKSSENALDRANKITLMKLQAHIADQAGIGQVAGSILGNLAANPNGISSIFNGIEKVGSSVANGIGDIFSWAFG